jgi:hypothetical protein
VPSTKAEFLYWIVQPLWPGYPSQSGFDRFFMRAPGMSRTEYEAPGHDLRKLYEAAGGAPAIEQCQIAVAGTSRPVHFVGPDTDLDSHARDMPLWLGSGGETKRPCWFVEIFHGSTDELRDDWELRTVAWWVMPQGFMFTLDPTVAENLVQAILLEAETHAAFGDEGWA